MTITSSTVGGAYSWSGAKEKETEDDIMNTLKQYFSSLDVPFNPNDIDRAYGVRLSHTDNHSGEKVKSMIVKV